MSENKANPADISSNLEDYLEAIYEVVKENGVVLPRDVRQRLGVGKSSVSGALKTLASRGLIEHTPYGAITLTSEGQKTAEDIARRHEVLRDFFIKVLDADSEVANTAACEIEHVMPDSVLERLVEFLCFAQLPQGDEQSLQEQFRVYYRESKAPLKEVAGLTLREIDPGLTVRVVSLASEGAVRQRLLDLGIMPGSEVSVERRAPLGDPIEVQVRGANLMLRKREAAMILVEHLREP